MDERIVSVTFPKCGTCRFALHPDSKGLLDCYGKPPVPLVLGATQDALGRPNLHIEAMVPKVKSDRPACSVYETKVDFATTGRS